MAAALVLCNVLVGQRGSGVCGLLHSFCCTGSWSKAVACEAAGGCIHLAQLQSMSCSAVSEGAVWPSWSLCSHASGCVGIIMLYHNWCIGHHA
jgi:hypothetical protein